MALTINLVSGFKCVDELGNAHRGGDITDPVQIVCSEGLTFERTLELATDASGVVFDTDNDLADFQFLWIESDEDVVIQFKTDQNNGVGDESYTVTLKAGIPLFLADDASYANYTPNFGGGTLDVIDEVRAKNLGDDTATVRTFAAR